MRLAPAFTLTLLLAMPADADPAALARSLVEAGAPAAGVGLYEGGSTRCAVAGVRAAGREAPVAEGDLWHVGSITKSMTATLAARLVVRGEIGWESSVGELLGPALRDLHPETRAITLEELLSHRAGLPANLGLLATIALILREAKSGVSKQRLAYAAAVLKRAPEAAPGTRFAYSNAGYVIAGAMLEQATGKPWEELMRAEVFAPLGLDLAGFGAPGRRGRLDQPRGHKPGLLGRLRPGEPGPSADNPPAIGPAGTVHLSLCDLLRYATTHATRPESYLPPEAWAALHADRGTGYALGWELLPEGVLTHDGSNSFWFAQIATWPDRDWAAAVVTNDGRIGAIAPRVEAVLRSLAP